MERLEGRDKLKFEVDFINEEQRLAHVVGSQQYSCRQCPCCMYTGCAVQHTYYVCLVRMQCLEYSMGQQLLLTFH